MSLCVDLVLNHTAAEHPWARAAAAGDPAYRAFYRVFPDRTEPDRYERTLPEVFPDKAPGSFTHVEGVGWVWTTFNSFQWDLDWSNPEVFAAMLDTMLALANRGVDVLRLDAAPFLWKREGTDCQNQPEVHLILQALRALVAGRGARRGVQGRGDRRAAAAGAVPRRARAVPARVRPRLQQPADGAALVVARDPGRRGWPASPSSGCGRRRRRRPGSPTCAATTTSAGPSRTRTRRAVRPRPVRPPRVPQRLLRRLSTPARSPAVRCSRPTRAPATAASRAARRRSAASRRRSPTATTLQADGGASRGC